MCRAGHYVTVHEKADRIGGLLRYGIPEFKLEKHIIDRRLEQMTAEGVKFVTNAEVGRNILVEDLRRDFDAIVLAGGAEQPRDLNVPGRGLKGIHFAMEFLPQQNKRCLGEVSKAVSGSRNAKGFPRAYALARNSFFLDRKSTRLNSSHEIPSRMPSSA